MLALLAAGVPDGAIAGSMWPHHGAAADPRPKARLGAATRFQVGLQAALLGLDHRWRGRLTTKHRPTLFAHGAASIAESPQRLD